MTVTIRQIPTTKDRVARNDSFEGQDGSGSFQTVSQYMTGGYVLGVNADVSNDGQAVYVYGGNSFVAGKQAGPVSIGGGRTGAPSTSDGAAVTIHGGNAPNNVTYGGKIVLSGGAFNAAGGGVTIYGGYSLTGNGGAVSVQAGTSAHNASNGGGVVLDMGAGGVGGAAGVFSLANATSTTGGSTATLTNSPTAGNPAGWLAVTINGTPRHIPFW